MIGWILKTRRTKWMAHVLCAFVLILCLAVPAIAGKKRTSQKKKTYPKKRPPAAESLLVNEMLRHLGVQYRRGGSGPGGVDCSGYVGLVYRNAYGLTLPHHSATLYVSSDLQKVPLDELRTGDLLFFTSSKRGSRISHVGIYLSEGRFVHAARRKGVIVSSLEKQYYSERIAGARRVRGLEDPTDDGSDSFDLAAMGAGPGTLLDNGENGAGLSAMSQSIQLSLFQHSLHWRQEMDLGPFFCEDSMGLEGRASSAQMYGVRLGKDIRPFPWMVVTPSLSYFDYEGDLDETGLPTRSVGLALSLGSEEDEWRIATGFHYLSLTPPKGYAEEEHAPKGLNMFFSFSKRLSEDLSFSLVGERLQRYNAFETTPARQERVLDDQRLSIVFDFSY